jgi:hypothetical protein
MMRDTSGIDMEEYGIKILSFKYRHFNGILFYINVEPKKFLSKMKSFKEMVTFAHMHVLVILSVS